MKNVYGGLTRVFGETIDCDIVTRYKLAEWKLFVLINVSYKIVRGASERGGL